MRQVSIRILAVLLVLIGLCTACKKNAEFTVKGVVADAAGEVMYLENVGVSSVTRMDSVKLTSAGEFQFKQPRPAYPDFYRLRLNNQLINFSVDSTETISLVADAETFATSYTIEGSEDAKAIKQITLAQLDANQVIQRLRKEYEEGLLADTLYASEIKKASAAYKEVALKYIYSAPMSTAAYFALFQQIDGMLFFDLYDAADSKAYGAVATSLDRVYPESPRAKHLHNLALQSIKVIRSKNQKSAPSELANVKTNEVGFMDIELPGLKGESVKLSEVAAGKPTLICFTAYSLEWSPALNMALADFYAKYHKQGLEIYQISLDDDSHFWKNAASNLPWVCVRDPQSVYSQVAALYFVRQLPAFFLLDSKGTLVQRIEEPKQFEAAIKSVVK